MLRRITTLVAIAAVIAPAAVARANDWEEDYSDEWRDESPRARTTTPCPSTWTRRRR